ncbi:MAG: LPXTG cell wall anchor domain-containing protein [Bryobacteraceae bacterium]|jgi:LPXTG-motif cell wall-anchored protein
MTRTRARAFAVVLGAFGALFIPNLLADEWNKKTILTVNEPIQVPGATLQPGKYVMKLMDSQTNRHIVQVFNADESHIITTVLAIPNYRLEPTGHTVVSFWETPPGQPRALRAWFYPGDNFGQEFAYPKNEAATIATAANANVPTTAATNESEYNSAEVTTTNPQGQEQALTQEYQAPVQQPEQTQMAQNTEPAPAPAAAPEPAPEQPSSLPKTGSDYPLIALAGLFSLGLFVTLRFVRAR